MKIIEDYVRLASRQKEHYICTPIKTVRDVRWHDKVGEN